MHTTRHLRTAHYLPGEKPVAFVCVFCPIYWRHSLCSRRDARYTLRVSRGLHSSVFFCPTRTNRGHTGGGKHRGFFLLFMFLFCPTVLLRCLPSFFIARRVRLSLSLVNTKVEFCLLAKLFSYKSLSTIYLPYQVGTKVRKI